MKKEIKLRDEHRHQLKKFVSSGMHSARQIRRAQVLLRLDQGLTIEKTASVCGVAQSTVSLIKRNYVQNPADVLEVLKEKPRPGRPPIVDQRIEAHISALACSQPPVGRCRWTHKLLAEQITESKIISSISSETVRLVLKKANSNPG